MKSIEQKHNLLHSDRLHSVEETESIILQSVDILPSENKTLNNSLGQVLANDITSNFDIPQFPNSSVDGYAVIHSDVAFATKNSPTKLKVNKRIHAGETVISSFSPDILQEL